MFYTKIPNVDPWRRGEQLFIRAALKRPTDPAVQVGALDADPRLVDLGPPLPVPVESKLQPQETGLSEKIQSPSMQKAVITAMGPQS